MTPSDLIKDVIRGWGALEARETEIEDLFWKTLWEVEALLLPSDILETATLSLTDVGDAYEASLTGDVIDVARVTRDSVPLVRVPLSSFVILPSWTQDKGFFAYVPETRTVKVNKTSGNATGTVAALFWKHTARSPSTNDLPILDRLYPVLKAGLELRVASLLKDLERTQLLKAEYDQLLGRGGENARAQS